MGIEKLVGSMLTHTRPSSEYYNAVDLHFTMIPLFTTGAQIYMQVHIFLLSLDKFIKASDKFAPRDFQSNEPHILLYTFLHISQYIILFLIAYFDFLIIRTNYINNIISVNLFLDKVLSA